MNGTKTHQLPSDVMAWREYDIQANNGEEKDEADTLFLFQTDGEELEELEFPVLLPSSSSSSSPHVYTLQLTCQQDYSHSTGMSIWQGSGILAEYLMHNPELVRGKKVLELGAGVGLVGLVAHHVGASRVLWTDGDSTVLKNLRRNVQQNYLRRDDKGEKASVASDDAAELCPQLIWGKGLDSFLKRYGASEVIFGTDLFYITKSLDPLFHTVDALLASSSSDGIFVATNACASYSPMSAICQVASRHGLECKEVVVTGMTADGETTKENSEEAKDDGDENEDERIYIFARKK